MPLTTETLTVASVEGEIKFTERESRERLRHLRALLKCLKDEANGQPALFDEPKE